MTLELVERHRLAANALRDLLEVDHVETTVDGPQQATTEVTLAPGTGKLSADAAAIAGQFGLGVGESQPQGDCWQAMLR